MIGTAIFSLFMLIGVQEKGRLSKGLVKEGADKKEGKLIRATVERETMNRAHIIKGDQWERE